MPAHTAMGGGGGGGVRVRGGGGGIFRGLRTNQSCQILVDLVSKVVFLIYRKKSDADCKAVRLYYSFLHFVKNDTTSSGNDWS